MQEDLYPSLQSRLLTRALGLFFHLLYHPLAFTYDAVAAVVSFGQWRRWVLRASEMVAGQRILELGFGPGHLQMHLHQQGREVFGLDQSAQMAHQAYRRLKRGGFSPRLARGQAQVLPFASGSFDSVVATFPTQYIVQPDTLAEIYRVLRPGGRLVVLFAAWITGQSLPEKIMAQIYQITGQIPRDIPDQTEQIAPFESTEVKIIEPRGSRLLFVLAQKKDE